MQTHRLRTKQRTKYTKHGDEPRNNKLKSKFNGFIFGQCNIFVNMLYWTAWSNIVYILDRLACKDK